MHKLISLATALAIAALALPTAGAQAADRYKVEIVNAASNLRVDVMWGSTVDFNGAFLWPNNYSASQEFDLLDSNTGFFRIRARHSGKCLMLDWRQGVYVNGTKVIQYPYCSAGYAPAEWGITEGGMLKNRATGRCLDADNANGGAPRAQSVIQQWECVHTYGAWNYGNQRFVIKNVW